MKKRLILLLSILFVFASFSFAEVITLDDAIKAAEENNSTLKVAKYDLEIAFRNTSIASSYIPNVSLVGNVGLNGSAIDQSFGTGVDASLGVSLDLGTSLISDAALKGANRTLSYVSYSLSEESVKESVTTSYLALYGSKKEIESAKLSLDRANENLKLITESYESGLSSSLDLQDAKLSVMSAEYDLKLLEDSYQIALLNFKNITGLEGDVEIAELESDVNLNLPSSEELYKKYASSTTSIRNLEANLAVSQAESLEAKINYLYPTVTLSGSWDVMGKESWQDYSSTYPDGFNDSASVTLSFSVPISSYIPGSSGSNSVKNSEDEIAKAKVNLNQGKKDLLDEIESGILSINQQKENVSLLESTLETAELKYDLSRDAYKNGLLTSSDLLDAERDLSSATLNLENAKCSYLNAIYDLSFTLSTSYEELVGAYAI